MPPSTRFAYISTEGQAVLNKLDRDFKRKARAAGVSDVVIWRVNAIDTTSAAGRFMLVVLAGAAEMERNLTRERTRSAMAIKRTNGQRIGTIPYGFNLADDGTTLASNESVQAVIRDIQTMRSNGMTLGRIAQALTERGVATKTGKSPRWTHQAVARILHRDARFVGAEADAARKP